MRVHQCQVRADPQTKQANLLGTWVVSSPVGCYCLHPPFPFSVTQPESRYSFYCPMEVEGWVGWLWVVGQLENQNLPTVLPCMFVCLDNVKLMSFWFLELLRPSDWDNNSAAVSSNGHKSPNFACVYVVKYVNESCWVCALCVWQWWWDERVWCTFIVRLAAA